MEKHTPAMRRYLKIKSEYPDCLLFYQMGDFYELFYRDAEQAAHLLDITLTSRGQTDGNPVPMAGVPVHSADSYIARLVRGGNSVVICDQVGDSKTTRGPVERKITRVVTPGTLTEEALLQDRRENLLAAIHRGDGVFGLAVLELSSGRFVLRECSDEAALASELERLQPAEILASEDQQRQLPGDARAQPPWYFDYDDCRDALCRQLQTQDLAGFGCEDLRAGVCAAGALLHYVQDTQRSALPHLRAISVEREQDYVEIDAISRACLEIDRSISGHAEHTLIAVHDHARSAMGARCLRRWFGQPLKDRARLEARQEAIAWLLEGADDADLETLRGLLAGINDVERIVSRLALLSARPRDLTGLRATLELLPEIEPLIAASDAALLRRLAKHLEAHPQLVEQLRRAIVEEPPATVRDGGVIAEGYDAELDELRGLVRGADQYLLELENNERQRTGVANLRVAYNKVHGYYVEVPKSQSGRMPEDYRRTQTLKNAERFTLPQLRSFESRVITARERALAREKGIYRRLLESMLPRLPQLEQCARALGALDVLATLAWCARRYGYKRPRFGERPGLALRGARHPVVERFLERDFVPNDLLLDDTRRMLIITGPNMGGKSTYMRQTALIVLLAHVGAFVPADDAEIGPIDRIFTRIGAADDIASGRSTFMVEMTEAANILNNATGHSLVLMDEIGRGTGTFDGLSLAWACASHLVGVNRSLTLFATHYFELTALARHHDALHNVHMDAVEHDENVVFLHKVKEGAASKSYGLQVARLAGIPRRVIEAAHEKLAQMENADPALARIPDQMPLHLAAAAPAADAGTATDTAGDAVRRELQETNLDDLSPRDALELLYRWKETTKPQKN